MTTWYEFLEGRKPMGDVVEFDPSKRDVQHVDSTTIVEKIELTPELKAEFEKQGYTFEEEASCKRNEQK